MRLLRHLREQFPDSCVTALVPPGYPEAPLREHADQVVYTERKQYGLRDWRALRRLRKQVRAQGCDVFVVMFDSSKLRVLAALSGARQRYCYTADGRFFPMRLAFVRPALRLLYNNIRGRMTYAYVRYVVYHRPVKSDRP